MAEEELSAEAMIAEVTKEASGGEAPAEAQSQEIKAPETPAQQMFKYKTSFGKEVEEPLEMVLKRAGYGYHYAQDKHKLEQEREAWTKEKQQTLDRIKALERWEAYDKYAKDNPEWANHVETSWNSRGQLQQQPQQDPYADRFKKYDETLEQLRGFMTEQLTERQKAQFQREDSQLAQEIQQVAKDYGVDLSQANENGESLEWQIIKHMEKLDLPGNRPGQFRAAFIDFYHPNLLGKAKETALEQTSKDKVELKKAGILDISRTPKSQNPSKGYKPGMSYDDLSNQILADYRAKA